MPRNSNGPIDPENPYRNKSPYRQMDNDPKTSREAQRIRDLDFGDHALSLWQSINPLSKMTIDFDTIGNPKTGFKVPMIDEKGVRNIAAGLSSENLKTSPHRGSATNKSMLKSDMCKCGSGMMKSMCKCGGMGKSMYKASDMCKCGSGMMKSMCKCGGMSKNMRKANNPIDPENPYRRKSAQRQMDNDPKTSQKARNSYGDLSTLERALTSWQKANPHTEMTANFEVIGNPKTGFHIPLERGGGRITVRGDSPSGPSRGSAARKRMYKADDKNKNTDWASKLSGAAVDFVLQNKNVIERKAKELSDQGFNYVNQHKSDIGRGAKNLTENGIDFLSANKSNIERGAKNVSDKAFDYVRRNKPNIEGVDYILNNKSNIEHGAKDISDQAFDYARRNKSGIGQAVERMTNQGVDYAIRSKPAIEQAAKNYSDQGFDYLRRNRNEIGNQARGLVSNVLGATTKKRAGAMSKSLQSNKKKNKYF
jgi:hypothetical protein